MMSNPHCVTVNYMVLYFGNEGLVTNDGAQETDRTDVGSQGIWAGFDYEGAQYNTKYFHRDCRGRYLLFAIDQPIEENASAGYILQHMLTFFPRCRKM